MKSDQNTALATVTTDDFAPAFILLLATVIENNPWLDCPWIVLSPPGSLSDDFRDEITTTYDRAVFIEDSPTSLQSLQAQAQQELTTPDRLVAAFLILEVFRFAEYERIICLDADMLCFGDISHLFECQDQFSAVRAFSPIGEEPLPFFNSGVFVVGPRYLGGPTYGDLVHRTRLAEVDPRTGKADQAVLNQYFYPHRVSWLPRRFNSTKRLFGDHLKSVHDEILRRDVRFLHFVGAKPWTPALHERDIGFEKVNSIWRAAARRYLSAGVFRSLLDARREHALAHISNSGSGGRR